MVEKENTKENIKSSLRQSNKDLIEERKNKTDKCAGCDCNITTKDVPFYYKCRLHGLCYCKDCTTNNGKEETDSNDVRTCDKQFRTNCIYEKKDNPNYEQPTNN